MTPRLMLGGKCTHELGVGRLCRLQRSAARFGATDDPTAWGESRILAKGALQGTTTKTRPRPAR